MSLEDLRSEIDAIDAQLIRLLAQRQSRVMAAAKYKADATAVRAADRRAAMMQRLGNLADDEGQSRTVATNVWNAMIDSFIKLEMGEHARISEQS